ncbi:hypothetical protein FISHEDRAFT_56401 [Fistulina hepatica ATCC 64428]|uniref:Uncharacterized protein n=1 Tax=Fistulina hepatica ATCC 64428 TaxID=1128425 RepID=A0A0D7AJG5_9AGAR|nr:hypothetical protein FISHEDRAFT_56401 [Fistulina hepatica ATCC 64428]
MGAWIERAVTIRLDIEAQKAVQPMRERQQTHESMYAPFGYSVDGVVPRRFTVMRMGNKLAVSDLFDEGNRLWLADAARWEDQIDEEGLPLILSHDYLIPSSGGETSTSGEEPLLVGEEYVREVSSSIVWETRGDYVLSLRVGVHHRADPVRAMMMALARAQGVDVREIENSAEADILGEVAAVTIARALDVWSENSPEEPYGHHRYMARRVNREGSHFLITDLHLRLVFLLARDAILNPFFNIGGWITRTRQRWTTRRSQYSLVNTYLWQSVMEQINEQAQQNGSIPSEGPLLSPYDEEALSDASSLQRENLIMEREQHQQNRLVESDGDEQENNSDLHSEEDPPVFTLLGHRLYPDGTIIYTDDIYIPATLQGSYMDIGETYGDDDYDLPPLEPLSEVVEYDDLPALERVSDSDTVWDDNEAVSEWSDISVSPSAR